MFLIFENMFLKSYKSSLPGFISKLQNFIFKFKYSSYLLQNQTRTTSFSMLRLSARIVISSEVGLGFCMKAFSKAIRTLVSIDVLFFLRLPIASGVVRGFVREFGLVMDLSASSNHFCSRGFNLHMFLNDRLRASNLKEQLVNLDTLF